MKKGICLMLLWCGVAVADMSRSGEIVTDSKTKLMWQDNLDVKIYKRTWQEGIDYCEALTFGGYSDWRLPNLNELKSIRNRYERYEYSINPAFVNAEGSYYSSTSVSGSTNNVWVVKGRDIYTNWKSADYYIRCVRTKQ